MMESTTTDPVTVEAVIEKFQYTEDNALFTQC
jgi:hypothetical protein